jgi:GTP-binding protein YchF
MKLGIIGKAGAGRRTIFQALTRLEIDGAQLFESQVGTVSVPDERLAALSRIYRPKKTTYAQVAYFLPARLSGEATESAKMQNMWNQVRECDALIEVVRNFSLYGDDPPQPAEDFISMDQELILSDLMAVEKRLERIAKDRQRGKASLAEEQALLDRCREVLENEQPLRLFDDLATAPALRGFAFLSAKPMLVLISNPEEEEAAPEVPGLTDSLNCIVIRGLIEKELAQMAPEDAAEYQAVFGIEQPAAERVIRRSYDLLGLISFFTVGEDEVKAWTIRSGTPAAEAAGVIHSDMQKGFIRAEVLAYGDLMAAGRYAEARKQGTVRLEGKTYVVQDGDLMQIRFNV